MCWLAQIIIIIIIIITITIIIVVVVVVVAAAAAAAAAVILYCLMALSWLRINYCPRHSTCCIFGVNRVFVWTDGFMTRSVARMPRNYSLNTTINPALLLFASQRRSQV